MHPSRRPLIAGNWKMHHGGPTSVTLAGECVGIVRAVPAVDLVIAPPFTALAAVAAECHETRVEVAGQNVHARDKGAFTGEVSASMLVECGCTWVIIGHSERRQHYGESDASVAEKAAAALAASLRPIVCVGETLAEREAGATLAVIKRQFDAIVPTLATVAHGGNSVELAIAYEPVWAIGTGKNASASDAEDVHAALRGWLNAVDKVVADRTRILYGGSVKADNAETLLGCPNVDGALVGGASLEAASFGGIARAAQALATRS